MGLFGNNLMPGESGGMRDEDWQRIYGASSPITAPSLDSLASGMATAPQGNPSLTAPMQAPQKSGGLFGGNSALWKVLGSVGDALSAANGIQPTYAPAIMQARQHQQTMAEKAADRQAEYQQAMDLARFKATDPGDDSFTRSLQMAGIQPGSAEYVNLARQRAQMLTQPVQLVDNGMGGKIAVRPNATAPSIPAGHVEDGYVFQGGDASNPANWKPAGGASGNAGGGFP